MLEALRDGLGAEGVGLFDDDRADPSQPSVINFWDAFEGQPCAAVDWEAWYRNLRSHERVEAICGCGGHRLCGFLIHGRWALLLVAPPAPDPAGAAAVASSLKALAGTLPPAKDREKIALAGQSASRPLAREPSLWWVRKGSQ